MTTWVKGYERNFDYQLVRTNDKLANGHTGSYYLDWHRTGPTVGVNEYKPSEGFFRFNNGIVANWSQVKLLLLQDLKIEEVRHAIPEERIWLDNHAGAIISYIGEWPGDHDRKEKTCLVIARDNRIFNLAVVLNSLKNKEVTI